MSFTKKRWLITGGCGFVGCNLIGALLKSRLAGSIRILDDLSVGKLGTAEKFAPVVMLHDSTPMIDNGCVEFVRASINESVGDWVKGAQVVVHLAANTGVQPSIEAPRLDLEKNVVGTVNILEAARNAGVSSFIFASSSAPLGRVQPPMHEDLPCRPMSPYGASKLAGEAYCSAYFWSYGLRTISLRFSNVYGPWSQDKGSIVASLVRRAYKGEPWIINGDGSQTRDFIYIDDLVEAVIASADFDRGGEVFQIGTGIETSVRELVDKLRHRLNRDFGIGPGVQFGPPLSGDLPRSFVSIAKARQLLGWAPKWCLDDGLIATLQWYHNYRDKIDI
jgi:UDP-glucose 4-epimerase